MKRYKLGEICRIASSKRIFESEYVERGVPFIRGQEISDGSILDPEASFECYISQSRYEEIKEKYGKPNKGDILITAVGTIGNLCYLDKDIDFYFKDGNVIWFSEIISSCDGKFLFHFMKSSYFKEQLKYFMIGAVQKALTIDMLKKVEVPLPLFPTQQKIAAVLSSLDDKIALNKKINAKLEAMAKRLYDYWFVQFDYPDKNGKPYKTSGGKMVWNEVLKREIPEGWEVKRLGELFITNRGVSYSTKTITGDVGIPMINLASFSPDGSYKIDGIKLYTGDYSQEKVLKPFDLVMCNTQQTAIDFSKDIIGKALLIPDIFEGDITSSHHVNTLKVHDEKLKFYLYRLFNTDYFHAYISHFASGTNIMGLDFAGVENYTAVIPSDEILSKFADFTLNIEKKKSEIIRENKKLTDLRDRLLPLLMNGQVEVGINNSSEFCNAKLGKQATACDMNGQVEVEG